MISGHEQLMQLEVIRNVLQKEQMKNVTDKQVIAYALSFTGDILGMAEWQKNNARKDYWNPYRS